MKITIYTITDCQFSKQEKEYLKAHNLPYEEKNLETNKEFLTEMLAISNNFAGTPVTRVEKDDGVIRVFKGFTKEEFDEFFGFSQPQENQPIQTTQSQQQTTDQNNQASPQPDSNYQTTQQSSQKSEPTLENQTENPTNDNPLNDVLSQLEKKVENNPQQDIQAPTTNEPQPLENTPIIQEEEPAQQPTNPVEETSPSPQNIPQIPDFPQDNK
ncbi:MAG: hypothetical protein KatS3mg092_0671 [Patescibacteria group bacterium]|nr:MAG: hypothetical protein KatS3mg092_0671 [Patescibacteria group bacterium]